GASGPVSIACGETTCGTDQMLYQCVSQGTFAPTGNPCTAPPPDLSTPQDLTSACTCTGSTVNGPATVTCGSSGVGTDFNTYQCTGQDTWAPTGGTCSASTDLGTGCTCSGTGLNGPVTVQCGGSACGTDSMTYQCTSQDHWAGTGTPCGP